MKNSAPRNDAVDASHKRKEGVFIRTFGCQMNEYDSLKLQKILEPGFEAVDSVAKAGLVIINTCSVREKPEQKLYSLLGQLRELKAQNSGVLIGVGGCVAQQEGQRIVDRVPDVDFVFGTHNLSLVPSLIESRRSGLPQQVAVDYRDEWEEMPLGLPDRMLGAQVDEKTGYARPVSVFVSISRGCDKNCAYCIVPVTRGREVSRPYAEIEREVRIAIHRGAKEVVLLGQTVNSYGKDLKPRMRFSALLQRLAQLDGLERIRFTSPHPQEVREDFIELVTSTKKVCRHIHMPLQSGSNRILKAMNRNYRRERYLKIIADLKSAAPDMAITTDVIVGFPGETEQDFMETMDILELVQFDNSYSFMFSPRPGTPAAELPQAIAEQEKLSRLQRFQARQEQITRQRLEGWIGREVEVLVEGSSAHDPAVMCGRTSQNIVVNIAASFSASIRPGSMCRVAVNGMGRFTLKGEFIAPSRESA